MATCGTVDNRKAISIITANAGYIPGIGHAALRQQAISLILNDDNAPALVFFQEFGNRKLHVTSAKWKHYNISDKYKYHYKGNDASFLYDKDKLILEDVDDNEDWKASLSKIRKQLKKKDQRLELALGRMPMAVVKMVKDENEKFACVSYHGPSSVSDDAKWLEIEGMLMLVTTWSKEMNLPLIIGGDFNLEFLNVSAHLERMVTKLPMPVIAHNYKAEGKRKRSLKVDFFIASHLLELKEIYPIHWNEPLETEILDHEPVTAKLQMNSLRTHRQINSFKEELMKKSFTEDIKKELKAEIKKHKHAIKKNIRKSIEEHAITEKIKEEYEKEIEEEIRNGMKEIKFSKDIMEDLKGTMMKKIEKDITETMKVDRYRKETPIGEIDPKTIEKIKKKIETEHVEKAKKNIMVEIQEKIEEEIDKEFMEDIKKDIKKDIEEEMKKES